MSDDEPTDDFGRTNDSFKKEHDEISLSHGMERGGMDYDSWLDRTIARFGRAIGLPPDPRDVSQETLFGFVGGKEVLGLAKLSEKAVAWAKENDKTVLADYPDQPRNSSGAPLQRSADVDRTGRKAGDRQTDHDDGGEDPTPAVNKTPSEVASSGGGKKKVVARRHKIAKTARGSSTVLTGPLGVIGGANVRRKKLLGS
jgi:hypothetical protein